MSAEGESRPTSKERKETLIEHGIDITIIICMFELCSGTYIP